MLEMVSVSKLVQFIGRCALSASFSLRFVVRARNTINPALKLVLLPSKRDPLDHVKRITTIPPIKA
jgi:hypothetical protein